MNIAFYINYGFYQDARTALSRLKAHGVDKVVTWIDHDVEATATLGEHELFSYVKDNALQIDAAIVPHDHLPYLSNTRYGRKDAIKAYKQAVLTAVDNHVPLLVMDAAPLSAPYVEALREICAYASENGVIIALRDAADADVIGVLSQVDDLYYCLDTAQCIKHHLDVPARVEALKSRLVYVILSDVGHNDERCLPTYGNTDFAPILAAVKASGYVGTYAVYASSAKGITDADAFIEAAKSIVK